MEKILVLDFGGQYNQLIARRVRDLHVYAEIKGYCSITPEEITSAGYKGIIFTGGPNSVYDPKSPHYSEEILTLGIPVLGICYGCQLLAYMTGGTIAAAKSGSEYGKTTLTTVPAGEAGKVRENVTAVTAEEAGKAATAGTAGEAVITGEAGAESALLQGLPSESICWMSHTDYIEKVPEGFCVTAFTAQCPCAAMEDRKRRLYGVQFHPEVTHTQYGSRILHNFLFKICGCSGDWTMDDFAERTISEYRSRLQGKKVLLALSGGVDSSVAAVLLHKAVGNRLVCVFVDHGLLRKDEGDYVEQTLGKELGVNILRVHAEDRFLSRLAGVTEPEEKRKIIGEEFIRVFEDTAYSLGKIDVLAQGTIYPDVIESGAGSAAVIKSHHNVGGLPDVIAFDELAEPLRELFKDEVRRLGEHLGIPHDLVWRQPFPGPGLAVRVIGEITREKLRILKEADAIFREEIAAAKLQESANQYFAVLTDLKSVGVKGDFRTYGFTIALRAVTTDDFMTADWAKLPYEVLEKASSRITGEIEEITRVVYDITSKPPATVEWE